MSTTTTTTRDRGDCYGPVEWAQLPGKHVLGPSWRLHDHGMPWELGVEEIKVDYTRLLLLPIDSTTTPLCSVTRASRQYGSTELYKSLAKVMQ